MACKCSVGAAAGDPSERRRGSLIYGDKPINVYVGNLCSTATAEEVRNLFQQFGDVDSVDLLSDRFTGESRGFGFVKMDNKGGRAAISALDKKPFGGRALKVNEAKQWMEDPSSGVTVVPSAAVVDLNISRLHWRAAQAVCRDPETLDITIDSLPAHVFRPNAAFVQTCGACGCTFRVEVEWSRAKGEQQDYVCPYCHDHVCHVSSPVPPRITLLSTKPAKDPEQ